MVVEETPIKLNEMRRTYVFPNNNRISLFGVQELIVRKSGTHRLKTANGLMHIIPTGWIHIEISSEDGWVV